MNVFVISLPDSIRQQSVRLQLNEIKYDVIEAIQTDLTTAIKDNTFNYGKYRSINKDFLPDNAIGCALSHFKAYNLIQKQKLTGAIILEDDFLLQTSVEQLSNVYRYLTESNFDVCLLGYSKMNKFDIFNYNLSNPLINRQKINSRFSIYDRKFKTSCGAVAYYISSSAVAKILKISAPYFVADEWNEINKLGVKINYIEPHLFLEDQRIPSSIENQRALRNKHKVRSFSGVIVDVIKILPRYIKGRLLK